MKTLSTLTLIAAAVPAHAANADPVIYYEGYRQ